MKTAQDAPLLAAGIVTQSIMVEVHVAERTEIADRLHGEEGLA